jgi:hypothetical protein
MFVGEDGLLNLDLEDVLVLYASIFDCTDQEAADQLRYAGELEVALARPGNYARYERADFALQAAVLAHGIASFSRSSKETSAQQSSRSSHFLRKTATCSPLRSPSVPAGSKN